MRYLFRVLLFLLVCFSVGPQEQSNIPLLDASVEVTDKPEQCMDGLFMWYPGSFYIAVGSVFFVKSLITIRKYLCVGKRPVMRVSS